MRVVNKTTKSIKQNPLIFFATFVTTFLFSMSYSYLTCPLRTRPLIRGKYPVDVEFGPKVLLNLKNKFLFLESLNFANVSDTNLLGTAIDAYKERFGAYPSQLSTDRGFWSKENYRLAEEKNISKIAIENKGKSSYLAHKPFRERLRRLRCSIEAKISLAKRKYGLGRIRYHSYH